MNKLAITVLSSLLACNAHAAIEGLYLSLGGGVVIPGHDSGSGGDSSTVLYSPTAAPSGSSQFMMTDVDWRNHYHVGYEFDIALGGVMQGPIRVEGEFLYQNIERTIGGTYGYLETDSVSGIPFITQGGNLVASVKKTVNIFAPMANVYFDFKNKTKWTPFAGLGIGMAWVDADGGDSTDTLFVAGLYPAPAHFFSPSIHGGAFAWQGKVGVNYQYAEKLSIDVLYRLFGTTDFLTGRSSIVTNEGLPTITGFFNVPEGSVRGFLNNSANVTFRYFY